MTTIQYWIKKKINETVSTIAGTPPYWHQTVKFLHKCLVTTFQILEGEKLSSSLGKPLKSATTVTNREDGSSSETIMHLNTNVGLLDEIIMIKKLKTGGKKNLCIRMGESGRYI